MCGEWTEVGEMVDLGQVRREVVNQWEHETKVKGKLELVWDGMWMVVRWMNQNQRNWCHGI
jgi:hypothetical protein